MSQWRFEPFPDPFRDAATASVPVTFRYLLRWCEQVWLANRTYASAIERTISYFLTSVEIGNSETDEQPTEDWRPLVDKVLDAMTVVKQAEIDSACYGSGFATFVVPFQRFLVCPRPTCQSARLLRHAAKDSDFRYAIPDFFGRCRACQHSVKFDVADEPHDVRNNLRIKHWSPHEIDIVHNLETGDNRVIWRIPPDYRALLKRQDCDIFHLERANRNVLRAVAADQLYEFHPEAVYQSRTPSLSGLPLRGWGIPHPLLNHRRLFRLQVLHRQCEALGLDYVTPFRVICPAPRQGSGAAQAVGTDPYFGANAEDAAAAINRMIRLRRRDPATIHSMPFPVQYQVFGAEANQFAPVELLKFEEEGLLADSGPPVELWRGTLQLQAAPVALRLMEASYASLVRSMNDMLRWIGTTASRILKWQPADLSLKRVTIADDIEQKVLGLQLMQMGKLSESILMRELGYDWKQHQAQMADDEVEKARAQARAQELLQEAGLSQALVRAGSPSDPASQAPPPGQAGAAPAGPAPGGVPPSVAQYMSSSSAPQTMDDLMAAADTIANDLMYRTQPERYAALRQLRTTNEPLHRLVTGQLKQKRQQINSQAGAAAQAQMQQQGAPPPGASG